MGQRRMRRARRRRRTARTKRGFVVGFCLVGNVVDILAKGSCFLRWTMGRIMLLHVGSESKKVHTRRKMNEYDARRGGGEEEEDQGQGQGKEGK